ncbi:galactoside 2-alpha-L-fucosyltransferase SEC1-like [Mytilus californianus]|uniref:galactoside 2-alpha-L-fucosyltransferase SEC1-like n=1 Tax=Mytilus californianus TaxID=6549 RepID=UPI0022462B0A|nr:galactoside 2-alpha-L-fucosyltransferase SEC1-like [Mytilus californianus]
MEFINKRCSRRVICMVCVSLIITYLVLSWLQTVPSIRHLHIVRQIWDKEYSRCLVHINSEANLLKTKQQPVYITVALSGRLGNWLFAYASLIGIARKNNVLFYTSPESVRKVSLANIFNLKSVRAVNAFCRQPIYEDLPCAYDKKMESLPVSNITIHGYLQSWKYFKHVEKQVREEFTFQKSIMSNAEQIFRQNVQNNISFQTTCIHVRRTDMMIASSLKIGFKSAPLEYLHNAVNHMQQKFNNKVKFLVISDDYKWCFKNLKFPNSIIIPRNTPGVDLALLSLCNSSIITTGTFGWWGAWLANGYTVYYKNYPEPGSRLDRETVKEDFYPPYWVPINSAHNQSTSRFYIIVIVIFVYNKLTYM